MAHDNEHPELAKKLPPELRPVRREFLRTFCPACDEPSKRRRDPITRRTISEMKEGCLFCRGHEVTLERFLEAAEDGDKLLVLCEGKGCLHGAVPDLIGTLGKCDMCAGTGSQHAKLYYHEVMPEVLGPELRIRCDDCDGKPGTTKCRCCGGKGYSLERDPGQREELIVYEFHLSHVNRLEGGVVYSGYVDILGQPWSPYRRMRSFLPWSDTPRHGHVSPVALVIPEGGCALCGSHAAEAGDHHGEHCSRFVAPPVEEIPVVEPPILDDAFDTSDESDAEPPPDLEDPPMDKDPESE